MNKRLFITTAICGVLACTNASAVGVATTEAELLKPTLGNEASFSLSTNTTGSNFVITKYLENDHTYTPVNLSVVFNKALGDGVVAPAISPATIKYFKWVVDETTKNKTLQEVTTPTETPKNYDIVASSNNNVSRTSFTANENISNSFIGLFDNGSGTQHGGAIFNDGYTIGAITGDFISNYAQSISANSYGGAIHNTGTIDSIAGSFIGNYVMPTSEPALATAYTSGGAINNRNTIDRITGDFIVNYAKSDIGPAFSGAIDSRGVINYITGDFIGNYALSTFSYAIAGAIYNEKTIGNITGDFISNYAQSTSSYARGGAIYNTGSSAKITAITGDFINNYLAVDGGGAAGVAIYNAGAIGNISGDFIVNYATSTSGSATGGAVYNTGTIDSIFGDFIGNYTQAKSSTSGAISNYGTIKWITGDFINNHSKSPDGTAATNLSGGAILNTKTIGFLAKGRDILISGNYVKQYNANEREYFIYNTGTVNFNAEDNRKITINDTTASSDSGVFNINKTNPYDDGSTTTYNGTVIFNSPFGSSGRSGTINLYSGTLGFGVATVDYGNTTSTTTGSIIYTSNLFIKEEAKISLVNKDFNYNNNTLINNVSLGNLTLNADLNLAFDVDLSGSGASDTISVTSLKNDDDKTINITEVNVINDATIDLTTNPLELSFTTDADLINKDLFVLSTDITTSMPSSGVVGNYLIDDGNINQGKLTFRYADLFTATNLDIETKVYSLSEDETIAQDLGTLDGTTLSINGNNKNILGGDNEGVSVASDQTLKINDVGQISNFDNYFITNYGTVDIDANYNSVVLESTAKINNDIGAVINLTTQGSNIVTLNNNITNMGTINISGNVLINSSINGNVIFNNGVITVGNNTDFSNTSLAARGDGVLDLANGVIQSTTFSALSLSTNDLNVDIDVDLAQNKADTINTNSTPIGDNKIEIKNIDIISDATTIETNVNIAGDKLKDYVSIDNANINVASGLEDYNNTNSYLITYSKESGDLSFKYANLQTAFSSDISQKIYSMAFADKDYTSALTLEGDSLRIDGNHNTLNASNIDINGKSLEIVDTIINSEISGTGSLSFSGNVAINSDMSAFGSTPTLDGGILSLGKDAMFFNNGINIKNTPTLNLQNSSIDTISATGWNFSSNLNVMIDVDLAGKKADSIVDFDQTQSINISGIYLTSEKQEPTSVSVTNGNGGGNFTISSNLVEIVDPIYIYEYSVDSSELATKGLLKFSDKKYKDENPAVKTESVSTQGIYNSNIDFAKQMLAAIDAYSPIQGRATGDETPRIGGAWIKIYGSNEDVKLSDFTVDSTTYTGVLGVDGTPIYYENGIRGIYSLYLAYINSTQEYDGVDINQDGINIGLRAMYDKGNWFAGYVANFGFNLVDGTNQYGKENFETYTGSLSLRTGYDINLYCQKYIMQPNITISYLYAKTPEYNNAGNVNIDSDALHAFTINPKLKFVAHLDNNISPYVSLGYNWTLEDGGQVKANDALLPQLSVDPYAEYKIGFTKKTDNGFSGYVEGFATSGGRQGFGGQIGLKWEF